MEQEKAKRGRKPNEIKPEDKVAKKRGRKPKGGKIVDKIENEEESTEPVQSVILHLKCFVSDIEENPKTDEHVEPFTFSNSLQYGTIEKENIIETETIDMKHISSKLKILEYDLHTNNVNKKSACFWCTCDFDTCIVNIPKKIMNDSYQVYGCFCSPECATSYLMNEHIDSSSKFERYSLLNHMYSKNYKKNIKPAPSPYYMLDKFYGNLTIQEYRALLKSERLFLTVEKPMSRILPEFHEDNEDFIINNKVIPSNFQPKKKKFQSDKFGLF